MNPRLRVAYNEWRVHRPEFGARCCSKEHWVKKLNSNVYIPIDDDLVCPRERSWRWYVRIRDRNRSFGTVMQKMVDIADPTFYLAKPD
jgi:hypothetical protein